MIELKNLIQDTWIAQSGTTFGDVFNPSRGEQIARVPMSGPAEVDAAVSAAQEAFKNWGRIPSSKRTRLFIIYRELLEKNYEQLARLVTLESGKTLDESKGDVRRGIEVVEFACGIAQLQKGESLPQIADQIDAVTMREPIGVCAGITPFNFPAMVPMWMYPLAIACGNTFVLKPSEKVPLTANRLAELFLEAGFPGGVLNIVHGGREVVDALCKHPRVAAISFVGSSAVAKHVYSLGCSHGKRVQAAGGAKNVMIVMPDAEPDSTLRAIMGSAFGCAGQRCMAGSLLMGIGREADEWRERVSSAISTLKVGDTSKNDSMEMGPVIDAAARARIDRTIETAIAGGAEVARRGAIGADTGFFVAPTLFDQVQPDMSIFRNEVFGPVLSLTRSNSLDEAISHVNQLPFGNGATLFTGSGGAARQFTREIQCGMLGINIGVPAPMALFSFSGWGESFYGDLHVQGTEGVMFYTRQRVVLSRWDTSYKRAHGW
jgi:malonate-semialdehyde dehydrogenase (acetylating)/methylmalonate-semialdehyde dehydrogenase